MPYDLFINKNYRYDEINSLATKCKPDIGEKCIGGYARTISAVKMLQESANNSVYLNAGDTFQGTLWYDKFKGNLTSYLLNLHPCDAIVSILSIFHKLLFITLQN